MKLINSKFAFVAVSVIVVSIFIYNYTFYDNTSISAYSCYYYKNELDCENNISFGDLLTLAELQPFVEVPEVGYDITNPLIFFNKINERGCTIYAQSLDFVFVNCIEVHNTTYTVDPSLINLLLSLNRII
jgi:hypothetical protein